VTDALRDLAVVVQRMSGIALRDVQLASLSAALRRVDPSLTPAEVLRDDDPIRRQIHLDRLVDQVTVNETFFLRHSGELEDIPWAAMVARAGAEGRAARVWSAACSSGEEAYSLALQAAEALGTSRPAIDVYGTDISGTALGRARRGVYGTRSMRLVSPARRSRWFTVEADGLRVGADLRAVVRFERHNLVRDPVPPAGEMPFDLIVCRNVLFYFDEATRSLVTAALGEALMPGGQLLLGTVDRLATPLGETPLRETRPAPIDRPRRPPATRAERPAARPAPRARAGEPPAAPDSALPDGEAHAAFETGVQALSAGDPAAAVSALRRALYLDPDFAVVAMQLARAYEALGDPLAARRAYWRALRLAEEASDPAARLYDRVGAADVVATCRSRLAALGSP
jgi:chemotaxis protein methyltransferase CheR